MKRLQEYDAIHWLEKQLKAKPLGGTRAPWCRRQLLLLSGDSTRCTSKQVPRGYSQTKTVKAHKTNLDNDLGQVRSSYYKESVDAFVPAILG